MTPLTEAEVAELGRLVTMTDPETQEVCVFCLDEYMVDYGKDDTGFCHNCASERLSQLLPAMPALLATWRRCQEQEAEITRLSKQLGHAEKEAEGYSDLRSEITTLRKQLAVAVAAFKGWEHMPSSVLTPSFLDDIPQAEALSKARNEFYADPTLAAMVGNGCNRRTA